MIKFSLTCHPDPSKAGDSGSMHKISNIVAAVTI